MFDLVQEPLPDARANALRSLMRNPALAILKSVIQSKAQTLQAQAVNEAVNPEGGAPAVSIANGNLTFSQRYENALFVLSEIESACLSNTPLTTIKLRTTPHETESR